MKQTFCKILFISLISSSISAFHNGGVASCEGCHIIHNNEDGTYIDPDSPNGNIYLLKGETASDICLSCHANQYGAVFGSDPLSPPPEKGAGNFVFLLEDNLNDINGSLDIIDGNAAGHNLNAPSKGVTSDPRFTSAPGGTFPSNLLGCTSCHDPHGNNNFRMLYGAGPIQNNAYTFTYEAPVAEGIDFHLTLESPTNHTAYKSGVSNWCGNCHGTDYHKNSSNNSPFAHNGFANFKTGIVKRYNRYNGTDDPMGAIAVSSYIPEVPFEDFSSTINSTQGPTSSSKIMCLTCHRAHGSSSPQAGRWDFHIDNLQDDGIESGSFPIPSPYENVLQTQLCHKCHSFQMNSAIQPVE